MSDPIPPGRWRTGSHAPRNLWIGGAHPEGVDVGRMDTPELAAYVVEAVNARLEAGEPMLTVDRHHRRARNDRTAVPAAAVAEVNGERDEARAEVERLRGVLRRFEGALQRVVRAEGETGIRMAIDAAREALGGGS